MALTLVRDCPQCLAAHNGFTFLAGKGHAANAESTVVSTCNRCGKAYAITFPYTNEPTWVAQEHGDFDLVLAIKTGRIRGPVVQGHRPRKRFLLVRHRLHRLLVAGLPVDAGYKTPF